MYISRKHYAWLLYIYVLSSKIHVDMHLYHWPIKTAHVVYTDVNKLQLKATLTFLFNKTYRVKPQQKQVRFRGGQKRILMYRWVSIFSIYIMMWWSPSLTYPFIIDKVCSDILTRLMIVSLPNWWPVMTKMNRLILPLLSPI